MRYLLLWAMLLTILLHAEAAMDVKGEVNLETEVSKQGKHLQGKPELELRFNLNFSPRTHAFMEFAQEGHGTEIGEAYLAYEHKHTRLEVGRFRLPFGIYHRSEVDYGGVIKRPLVKAETINGFRLARVDTGLQLSGGSPRLQYQVALVSGSGDAPEGDRMGDAFRQVNGLRGVSTRLQTYVRDAVVGLNFYQGRVADPLTGGKNSARFVGVDWRYTKPFLLLRGEVVRGQVGSQRAWGYYADLFYHFPYAERVTGILRYETFDPDTRLSGDKRRRWVMGAKYLLPPGLTISLNYVREPSAPAGQRSAAQLQIFQTFHFGGG